MPHMYANAGAAVTVGKINAFAWLGMEALSGALVPVTGVMKMHTAENTGNRLNCNLNTTIDFVSRAQDANTLESRNNPFPHY